MALLTKLKKRFLNSKQRESEVITNSLKKTREKSNDTQPGCNIIGHIYAPSGRGEDARCGALAAQKANIPFSFINTFGDYGKDGKGLSQDSKLRKHICTENPYDINIFFINADEMHHAYEHLGDHFHQKKYNIGYWAWELREFPDAWLPSLDLVDEIWAPSRFIQDAISQKTNKPVIYMPLVVSYDADNPLPRSYFNIPTEKFVFLTFFDFTSYFQRKNPFAVINAFKQAFPPENKNSKAHLIIKLNNWDHDDENYKIFIKEIKKAANIQVLKKVYSDSEMKSLVNCCDCFVSLHRSEGFGRGPAEAMALKKPVIVTGYSGNMDYCNEANSFLVDANLIKVKPDEYIYGDGQIWADADIDHATTCMQEVFSQPQLARQKAESAYNYITNYHGPTYVGKRYRRRITQIINKLSNKPK